MVTYFADPAHLKQHQARVRPVSILGWKGGMLAHVGAVKKENK